MLNLIYTLAAGSSIFLAFLVATVRRDENRLANRWLAVFLLMLGLFMLDDSLLIFGLAPALFLSGRGLGRVVFRKSEKSF